MLFFLIAMSYIKPIFFFFLCMAREMENVNGYVKFQNHYGRVHVQLSGNCNMWRSDANSRDGGWLSADVFVDTIEQKWHANLKTVNLFVPVRYTVKCDI